MFDIGWSELVVIAVVALIAIGPKELPGVLRMVGQWMTKARRMAADFQGQFQEAMREAEVAEMKQQFDDLSKTADNFTTGNPLSDIKKDVESALSLSPPAVATSSAIDAVPPEIEPATPAMPGESRAPEPRALESSVPAPAEEPATPVVAGKTP